MQQFFAREFFETVDLLANYWRALAVKPNEMLKDNSLIASMLQKTLERLRRMCGDLKFKSVVREVLHLERRMRMSMNDLTNQQVVSDIESILRRVKEALLEGGVFMHVAADKARWHSAASIEKHESTVWQDEGSWSHEPIPPEIIASFGSAVPELTAARDCFATDAYTACVFHLMRASEYGLRALAQAVGVTLGHRIPLEYEVWNVIIENAEKKVNAVSLAGWSRPAKENYRAFYNGSLADFEAFKDTCRNLLMHTRSGMYNEQEAMGWMLRVTDRLKILSTRISETSTKVLLDESDFST